MLGVFNKSATSKLIESTIKHSSIMVELKKEKNNIIINKSINNRMNKSLKNKQKKGIIIEELELNKGFEEEKEWRTNKWINNRNPMKNPMIKWITKIRLIITFEEHIINSAM